MGRADRARAEGTSGYLGFIVGVAIGLAFWAGVILLAVLVSVLT